MGSIALMYYNNAINMKRNCDGEAGYSLVELSITLTVFVLVALGFMTLFISLISSTIVSKRQAVGLSLATTQMEYLKSLPYDNLAVAGGSIYSQNPLPSTSTQTINGVVYTIRTSISYVDDAYDGCGSYPNIALEQLYCRNYPPPSNAPVTDLNPADYKIVNVEVTDPAGNSLAEVDTEEAPSVAETASSTGALFVKVLDASGNPVSDATVTVTNTVLSPNVNVSDSTDQNGNSIFYDIPPDANPDYVISASKTGYSTLATIPASGSLQPTYPNQKIITQQSSYVTLTIQQQAANSLVLEAVDTSGNPLPNAKIYTKGGYKKYTLTSDTSYYYDNMSPSDIRPTTDASGLAALQNLTPGTYVFCGDNSTTNCKVGGTTYYLVAAIPYASNNPLIPITVPVYDPSNPPSTTFSYGGNSYVQKVRLIFSTSSNFLRISDINPGSESLSASDVSNFAFTLTGANLPCTNNPVTCGTTVKFIQGANTFTAACTGTSGTALNCTVNLSTATVGNTQLMVSESGNVLTLPVAPPIGGLIVTP
jgi:protocatechuate 3,4-dioxygenase beta subunit